MESLFIVVCLAVGAFSFSSPEWKTESSDVVNLPDRYIVTLHPMVNVSSHLLQVQHTLVDVSTADESGDNYRGALQRFDLGYFRGYAGHSSPSTLREIKSHADVAFVEPDQAWNFSIPLTSSETDSDDNAPGTDQYMFESRNKSLIYQSNAPPGLQYISHRHELFNKDYWYKDVAGHGTYGYIVDSGVSIDHEEVKGRATLGFNAVKGPFVDSTGHGTHIASIMGGKTYGVAKRCNLIAVKMARKNIWVLSDSLTGFQWAVRDIRNRGRQSRAVINVSSGFRYSRAYNRAVNAGSKWGVSTVVSAGNQGKQVNLSPATSKSAITVGATSGRRRRATFSNYGGNVTLFAPGVHIIGAWIGHNGRSTTAWVKWSGTSMAAPHVSGLVLYFKSIKWLPGSTFTRRFVVKVATRGTVKDAKDSVNLFAYNDSGK